MRLKFTGGYNTDNNYHPSVKYVSRDEAIELLKEFLIERELGYIVTFEYVE